MASQDHRQSLSKLCRVCGKFVGKSPKSCHAYSGLIKRTVYMDIFLDTPDIHPTQMCVKCYAMVKHIDIRKSTYNETNVKTGWKEHLDIDCQVCNLAKKQKKGGRPQKKYQSGRPSQKRKLWTRQLIESIVVDIPADNISLDINPALNPHFNLCKCSLCENIFRKPVVLPDCQHSFCSRCILPKFEGKSIEETKCPTCHKKCKTVSPNLIMIGMLKCFKIECEKGCKATFKIEDLKEKTAHEHSCNGPQTSSVVNTLTLNDIFAIADSNFPREAEDLALHVIKKKINESESKIAEFKAGGPRVSY